MLVVDGQPVGLAPAAAEPSHSAPQTSPSGPVNPDAILLFHIYITDEHRSVMMYVKLINAAGGLPRPWVRAVEAFGREGYVGSYAADANPKSALDHVRIPTRDVLSTRGFKEIVPHPRVSRWRVDVDKRNLWQFVKAALDQRYIDRMIELITYESERAPTKPAPEYTPARIPTDAPAHRRHPSRRRSRLVAGSGGAAGQWAAN